MTGTMENAAVDQPFADYIDQMSATLKKRVDRRGPLTPPPPQAQTAVSEEVQLVPVTRTNFDMVEVHRVIAFEDDGAALWAIVPQHILAHANYPGPPPCPAEWVTFAGREVREFCSAGRTVPQRIEVHVVRRGIGSYKAPQPSRHLVDSAHGLFRRDVCETAVALLDQRRLTVSDMSDEPSQGELKLWASLVLAQRGWVESGGRNDIGNEGTRCSANEMDSRRRDGLRPSEAVDVVFGDDINERLESVGTFLGETYSGLRKERLRSYREQRSARAGRDRPQFPLETTKEGVGYDLIDPRRQEACLQEYLRSLPGFWRQLRAIQLLGLYVARQRKRLRRIQRSLAISPSNTSRLDQGKRLRMSDSVRAVRTRWVHFQLAGGREKFVSSNPDLADEISRGRVTRLSPSVTRPLIVLRNAMTSMCWEKGGKTAIEKT